MLRDHFDLCHKMTLDAYTIRHAAEIAKTVVVRTLEEKVKSLGEAAATKKRKVDADHSSNPKRPKLGAAESEESQKAVIESVAAGLDVAGEAILQKVQQATQKAIQKGNQQQQPLPNQFA